MAARLLSSLAVLVAVLALASAQVNYCSTAGVSYVLSGTNGTFGCNGYVSGQVDWYIDNLWTCTITGVSMNLVNAATVSISTGYSKVNSYSGNTVPGSLTVNGLHATFSSSYSYTGYGFSFKYSCVPLVSDTPVQPLVSKQSVYVANKTHGGFVYISLGRQVDGKSQAYSLSITSYKGLKPPSFFVGFNRLPTLESSDWTNTTAADGAGGYVWNWAQNTPRDGVYVIGMFLYGTFGGVYANSTWNYKYDQIPINTPITKSGAYCGQVQFDRTAKSFTIQVSREAPGGFPIFYLGKGYKPSAAKNEYVLDTNVNSFQELTVKNPVQQDGPNPGLWIVCTQPNFSGAFVLGVSPAF